MSKPLLTIAAITTLFGIGSTLILAKHVNKRLVSTYQTSRYPFDKKINRHEPTKIEKEEMIRLSHAF
jgi:hypothetical protein